ncbi:MAG: VCBS repeat-containing protein [Phaeodactylibacter sp.]|nr:VCBS repeat-containing protein [Phaeodactylibacter sp.]
MKYQPLPVSKTYRRFVALAGKVQRLLESGQFQKLSAQQQKRLADKLRQLYRRLSAVFSQGRLRRILASAALVVGLGGGAVQAQQFATPVEDPFGLNVEEGFYLPFFNFADLDNDGDQDLLAIQYSDNLEQSTFRYYENTGTAQAPAFAAPQANPFGLSGQEYLTTPFLVDIDNDGDLDLFAGTYFYDSNDYTGRLFYFENQGTPESPAFAAPTLNPFGLQNSTYYMVPAFVDLDGDGDFDLLGTSYNTTTERDEFRYQENTGTANAPQFGAPANNPFGLSNPDFSVIIHAVGDLDMDGDYDVLVGGGPVDYSSGGFLQYLENTGTAQAPAFAAPVTDPFGIDFSPMNYYTLPSLVDIDNDGDLDLFVAGYSYDENTGVGDFPIWYFENTTMVNSREATAPAASLKAFPTVTDSWLNWQVSSPQPVSQLHLEAFAGDGRRVGAWRVDGQRQGQVDVGNLPGGLYQLRLSDGSGRLLAQERFVVR